MARSARAGAAARSIPSASGQRRSSNDAASLFYGCRRSQAGRRLVRLVARRLALRTEPRQAAAYRVAAPIQTLAATRTASRKPSNGCPEVVSASNPVRALRSITHRLRFADCAPPKDSHLCATTSANSRFRQPVSCSDRTWAARFIPKEGRRTTLSLPDRPPHSRVGLAVGNRVNATPQGSSD